MIASDLSTSYRTRYAVLVISLCACFLFYKYIVQNYPSIITGPLMQEFHLSGAGLGNLAATFYYTYLVTQLFVGILLDRFSTRFITSAAILSCALGVFFFSHSTQLVTAEFFRALMGVGVAFATVTYMKLAANWFPPEKYAFVSGLLATAAMAGAVFGQAPLSLIVNSLGWRTSLSLVGIVGIILSFLFLLTVRDSPSVLNQTATEKHQTKLSDVIQVFKKKQNWLLTLYSGLAFSPIAVFGGLWGNPFLQTAYHLNKTQAASLISLIFLGLGIGSPILGLLSDKLGERRNVMLISTLLSCFSITLVVYCQSMNIWLLGFFLFVFGFCLGAYMLVFTMGKEYNHWSLTATVIAMINTSDALLDSITEPAIGKLLDIYWDGKWLNGVHSFSLSSYHVALSILPIYLLLATLTLFWINPKKQTSTEYPKVGWAERT